MKQVKKSPRAKKGRKAGIIAAGAVVLMYSALFPLYRVGDYIPCALLAILIGKVVSIMGAGLDVSTRNREDAAKARQVEELPLSGDEGADAVIARGQEMLHQIRAENDAILDEALSAQMDELERLCVQIFTTVAEKPAKAPQIRKFMNYYLPTTLKVLGSYRMMDQRGVSAEDMAAARSEAIRGMGMVLTACQKQLDNLYKDTILDVSTDIDVMEQMLKRDGYAGELRASSPSATAASAQMKATNPKVIPAEDEDFVSFYSQDRRKQ